MGPHLPSADGADGLCFLLVFDANSGRFPVPDKRDDRQLALGF